MCQLRQGRLNYYFEDIRERYESTSETSCVAQPEVVQTMAQTTPVAVVRD